MTRELLQQALDLILDLEVRPGLFENRLTTQSRKNLIVDDIRAALASPEPQGVTDERKSVRPPMRHISGVNVGVLKRAALASQAQPASEDKPVAWIEVGNSHSGPYTFHGIEYLPEGRHNLYTHPAPADQDARDAARYRWLREQAIYQQEGDYGWYEVKVEVPIQEDVNVTPAEFDAAIERAGEKK